MEKKILILNAKSVNMTMSEYIRSSINNKKVVERLSDEQIEFYLGLMKFHNDFKRLGNLFRKKDPNLKMTLYQVAKKLEYELDTFRK